MLSLGMPETLTSANMVALWFKPGGRAWVLLSGRWAYMGCAPHVCCLARVSLGFDVALSSSAKRVTT